MARYRHKPLEIDAIRWTGDNFAEIEEWAKRMHPKAKVRLSNPATAEIVINWPEELNKGIGAGFIPPDPLTDKEGWVTFDTIWGIPQFGTAHLGNNRLETFWEPIDDIGNRTTR